MTRPEPSPKPQSNPLLSGGAYDAVQAEETVLGLRVTGTIPEHLDGRYVRNGPNPIGPVNPKTFLGELVFVPAGPDAAEGEGVLMGFVHDGASGEDRLDLLDAATLEPVAQVHLPVRVPHGFHGNWLPTL